MGTELSTIAAPAAVDLASGQAQVDACTHCGICLESCPTYTLGSAEADSPRGRIVLIGDAIAAGDSFPEEAIAHIDSCLGCMACVESCPEGVRYDELLRRARVTVEAQRQEPLAARVRSRLTLATRTRSGRVRELARVQPIPHFTGSVGPPRGRVGLLLGCTQRAAHTAIHIATLGVLAAEGYEVIAPRLPDCCGAIQLHAGEHAHGLRRAQATIEALKSVGGVDKVVVSTGGCGAAMKRYGELLGTPEARAFSSLVIDVHELLAQAPAQAPLAPMALRVAFHDACQLRHGQGIASQPRQLLERIPDLTLIELPPEAGACCGAPGLYASRQPIASAQLAERQAEALVRSGAQVVTSGDYACIAQLRHQLERHRHSLPVHHPIELLWSSIRAAAGS